MTQSFATCGGRQTGGRIVTLWDLALGAIVEHADRSDPVAAILVRIIRYVAEDLGRSRRELAGEALQLMVVSAFASRVRRLTFSPWPSAGRRDALGSPRRPRSALGPLSAHGLLMSA
jgi:hypothetical protein